MDLVRRSYVLGLLFLHPKGDGTPGWQWDDSPQGMDTGKPGWYWHNCTPKEDLWPTYEAAPVHFVARTNDEAYVGKQFDFHSIEQLRAIPFVKGFIELPDFHQLSISRHEGTDWVGHPDCLIAQYRGGRQWWVVGYIKGHCPLPEWDHGIYETEIGDIPGRDVRMSCGDLVHLRDGRVVKRKE
jgi:hypothetical protein